MGAVDAAREVSETRTARAYAGTLLDVQTASAIVAVAEALSVTNRERLNGLSVADAGTLAWKLVAA